MMDKSEKNQSPSRLLSSLRRIIISALFLAVTGQGIIAQDRISISGTAVAGGDLAEYYGFGGGVRWNNLLLEASSYANPPFLKGWRAEIDWFLPGTEDHISPYLGLQVTGHRIPPEYRSSFFPELSRNSGIDLKIGAQYRLFKGFSIYQSMGIGLARADTNYWGYTGFRSVFGRPEVQFGARYDLVLRGARDLASSSEMNASHSLPLEFYFRTGLPDLAYYFRTFSHKQMEFHFAAGVPVTPWLKPYLGVILGGIRDYYPSIPPDYLPAYSPVYSLKGVTLGARIVPIRREKWSFFHDVSFSRMKNQKYRMDDFRVSLGNYLSWHINENVSVFGGMGLFLDTFDFYKELSAGVQISPFRRME